MVQDERASHVEGAVSLATLAEIAEQHNTDKDTEGRALIRIYDWLLTSRRHLPTRLLEIGVAHGGSLRMWRDYFR